MDTTNLFAAALNLPEPWFVSAVDFKDTKDGSKELHIEVSFARGSKFSCPECDEQLTAYDTTRRTWRHLN